jgi:hypothetical protein
VSAAEFLTSLSDSIAYFFKRNSKVPDLTASIMEPLTVQMTDEQLKKKHEQQKARAPPPGQSRILSRASRDQRKNKQVVPIVNKQPIPPLEKPNRSNETVKKEPAAPVKLTQADVEAKKSFVEVKSATEQQQQQQNKANTRASKIVENTDAEEWQNLIEELNPGWL